MAPKYRKLLACFLVVQILLLSSLNFFIGNSYAQAQEIKPEYGERPEIDGYHNETTKEWKGATKLTLNLTSSSSKTDVGLPVQFWVLQNDSNIYFSLQFELEYHNSKEFVGIVISNKDVKIIQFSNINEGDFDYLDYHIENNVYKKDVTKDGEGAATLNGKTVIYEFGIPINRSGDDEDVFLDYGEVYAFKVIFGESPSYPNGILKEDTVNIEIQYPPHPPVDKTLERVLSVLAIIIFISLCSLYAFFLYKIIILSTKLNRKL